MMEKTFSQELQFSKWMAACRFASRGKTMADASYSNEVESIKKMLQMQAGSRMRD